jgi:16S rRNA (cytidine1402-2'-O)-methyltransferase
MSGTLFVVATPIGNLEDITLRALRVLREVALIAAEDTRRTAHLLARHGVTTPTTSLHEHNERQRTASLLARLRSGEDVALVSDAGTPTVSDPGVFLIRAASEAGIRVEPIPGPNAAVAALSVSGFDADRFTFFGFPPTRSRARADWFAELRKAGGVVVFYEAPHRIASTLGELLRAVGDRPIFVARELTKAHEQLVKGPISEVTSRLAEAPGEFTVVVDIGESTKIIPTTEVDPEAIAREFCELTKFAKLTRRQAITKLSRSHGLPARAIYTAIEDSKRRVD